MRESEDEEKWDAEIQRLNGGGWTGQDKKDEDGKEDGKNIG